MLKIRINNEEVVSNKDFTINEEMLNTSSVILNNVYPKTWEDDKDYVSRFYHPNDYSKCLISDETDVPEEPGTTVEDTSFSINVDTTKEYEFTSYKGQTTQSGTPTPTAPQPINVVSGRQDVNVIGKNLFNASLIGNYTSQGVNISQQGQEVILSGTPTRAWGSTPKKQLPQTLRAGETYYFSSNSRVPIRLWFYASTTTATIVSNVAYNTSFTPSEDINAFAFVFEGLTVGQTYNETLTIQVEKGSATEYEAYKENTYKINLGKNLFPTYSNSTLNGVSLTVNGNGTVNLRGTATANTPFLLFEDLSNSYLVNGETYTMSANQPLPNGLEVRFEAYNGTVWKRAIIPNITTAYRTRTGTANLNDANRVRCCIYVANGTSINVSNLGIQVEKGSSASSYAEYKTPIELCKIGNYQDRIFKSSGKNLLDNSNTQIGIAWNNTSNTGRAVCYVSVKPNTTYTASLTSLGALEGVYYFGKENTTDSTASMNVVQITTTRTFTTTATTNYIGIQYNKANITQENVESAIVMLNEGSTALPYEPYGTGWFIEKNIGKVVLNGSQNITLASSGTRRFNATYTALGLTNIKDGTGTYDTAQYRMCDHFRHSSSTYNAQQWGTYYTYNNWLVLYDTNTVIADANALKTWFTNNPTSIYYVLATPTYTEITDSELISQLEGIELIEGLNNIGISTPYLPMIMNLHYNYVIPRTDVDILFCGVVKNSGNISLNPRDPHYQTLQILSYKTFLSEGETLDFVIYQKTIKEAIEQVVGVIADYGFVVGNINLTNGDEVIGAYSTKDKTAYDVFNYLADITQSRWTTRLIDENTVAIDFYDPTLLPLGTAIDYTNECFENHTIDNMSYSYGSNDYRNKQVMTSQEVYSNISQTQSVIANGYQTQFNVEQKIGKINYIKIGATFYTIATNQEKEMGVSADFYYTPGNNYFESVTTIAVGTSITIEYIPIVEGRQIISNSTEIDRIANSTGVKGVIARYENRNDAITSQELQKIGQSYIKYKGVPEIILTVQTRSNLWNIGDRVPFNAPIDELKTEYMVKTKKINYITTIDTIFYTYELTSSFNSENAINYFDNQRAKATGNIGSGEYISRNIDIQSDANIIFYDTTATEIEIVGDNTLEAVLEAPFVS